MEGYLEGVLLQKRQALDFRAPEIGMHISVI